MREIIRMVVVLTLLAAFSGGLLAAVEKGTKQRIEDQRLKNIKGPVLMEIFKGCQNNPVDDRFQLKVGDAEKKFFVGVFDGTPEVVAFEAFGKGYGGDMGVMVAVNVKTSEIVGIGVTTHAETPGLGARAAEKGSPFAAQFAGKSITDPFSVKQDGGDIDSITGATITSRGVCQAVTQASELYEKMKPEILAGMKKTVVVSS